MGTLENLVKYKIVLASKSPRRKQLLENLGVEFIIISKNVEEFYPLDTNPSETALFLSELKANAFPDSEIDDDTLIITADTIVSLNGKIMGKPKDKYEAKEILKELSGKNHEVITGVTLKSKTKFRSFAVKTKVHFKNLNKEEIDFYVDNYKPMDKAGAYGIQEWIGYIGIDRIEGSFYNVMGLPTQKLYEELLKF